MLRLLQQQKIIDQELYDAERASAWRTGRVAALLHRSQRFSMADGSSGTAGEAGDKIKDLSGVKIFTTFDSWRRMPQKKPSCRSCIPALEEAA